MTREDKLYTQEKREKEIRQTKQRNPGNGMLFRVCVCEKKKKQHYFVFSEVQDTLLLLSKKGFYKKREQAEDKKKVLK